MDDLRIMDEDETLHDLSHKPGKDGEDYDDHNDDNDSYDDKDDDDDDDLGSLIIATSCTSPLSGHRCWSQPWRRAPLPAVQYSSYRTVHTGHYIILDNGILKSNSSVFPRSEGFISQYTP